MDRNVLKYPGILVSSTFIWALYAASSTWAADASIIKVQELKSLIDRGEEVTLVDVRTPEEYEQGHIPGSLSIPLSTIGDLDAIPGEGKLVLYCTVGVRGGKAMKILARNGISHARNLEGGIEAWVRSGGEVTTDSAQARPEQEDEDIYFTGYPKTFEVPKGVCEQKPPSMKYGE